MTKRSDTGPHGYSDVPVAEKLPSPRSGSTIRGASPVILRTRKNRKRPQPAQAAIKSLLPAILRVIGATAATVGIAVGAWQLSVWAKQSPRFAITSVQFFGNSHATDAELIRVGGLTAGQNLVALDAFALERAIAAHPWVKTVRADRKFPNRIEIRITEHTPVAMVSLGDLYLLDDDGEPFKRVTPADALDLPIITGVEREDFLVRKEQTLQRLTDALKLAADFTSGGPDERSRKRTAGEPAGNGEALSEVHLDDEGVTLVTASGQHLLLGEGHYDEKLARLDRVRQELKARAISASVIRLDNRARPASITISLKAPTVVPERGSRPGK